MIYSEVVDFGVLEYDTLCHNNQDGSKQVFCTVDQVFSGKNFERGLSIPTFFLAFLIPSLRCFPKPESRIRQMLLFIHFCYYRSIEH